MNIQLRYQAMQSTGMADNVEGNIVSTELLADLDPTETALVLVDTWGEHPIVSHCERTGSIVQMRIRPALEAARVAGITPIYAPSPHVAARYPRWTHLAGIEELRPSVVADDDWPPLAYRELSEPYTSLRRAPGELPLASVGRPERWHQVRTIHAAIAPTADDVVIASGDQLHRVLRDRRLVHLVYVGFATNICIRFRDYGMRAMKDRGYRPILLRDATSGIETRETYDDFSITRSVLQDLERWFFTASVDDFVVGCREIET
jgi:hypothetical protein